VAQETKCLTNGAVFKIAVGQTMVSALVDLPFELKVSPEEAETLEKLIHNQMELVLRSYFESR
jgi:hypothetical protein